MQERERSVGLQYRLTVKEYVVVLLECVHPSLLYAYSVVLFHYDIEHIMVVLMCAH